MTSLNTVHLIEAFAELLARFTKGYFSVSTRMNGAGRVGWLAGPLTRTSLGHVHLKVSNLTRSENFYRDVLRPRSVSKPSL
jgi:catechol-2,3-dioxygenase